MTVQRGMSPAVTSTPLPGLLFVLFLGLKLTGNIDWSWWWVLAPMWVPIVLGVVLGVAAVMVDTARMNRRTRERRRIRNGLG